MFVGFIGNYLGNQQMKGFDFRSWSRQVIKGKRLIFFFFFLILSFMTLVTENVSNTMIVRNLWRIIFMMAHRYL